MEEIHMKRLFAIVFALGMMLTLVQGMMAAGDKNRGEIGQGDTHENGCEDQPCLADAPKPGPSSVLYESAVGLASELDETEINHLIFIREEEKLARDVYGVLYETWGNPVFATTMESEQTHMDAMANLLAYYGIPDPILNDAIGEFTDDSIGILFEDLTDWGADSRADALLVGGFIEEYDILDIWRAYEDTDEAHIQRVYQNLYEGSYNHLDAFVYNYELQTGETYVPQLLSDTEFDLVMAFATQAKQVQKPEQRKGK